MSAEFVETRVAVEGGAARYAEAGTGAVVVVIGETFAPAPAHALLAQERRVIVVALDSALTAQEEARRIAMALAALGLSHFDVMAHGTGAEAALSLGIVRPDAVGAIVLVAPEATELQEKFGGMTRPVLALFGTKDDAATSGAGGRYRALLPDCHLMFVYDAGRDIAHERPEALAYIAREFFERRDLFLVTRESGLAFP